MYVCVYVYVCSGLCEQLDRLSVTMVSVRGQDHLQFLIISQNSTAISLIHIPTDLYICSLCMPPAGVIV